MIPLGNFGPRLSLIALASGYFLGRVPKLSVGAKKQKIKDKKFEANSNPI